MKIQVIVGAVAIVAGLFYFKVVKMDDLARYQCRSKQSEAKSMLKEAHKKLGEYGLRNGRVVTNWLDLAWEPKTTRYDYSITFTSGTRFTIEAHPKQGEMNGDVWQIDEGANLTNTVDGCAHPR